MPLGRTGGRQEDAARPKERSAGSRRREATGGSGPQEKRDQTVDQRVVDPATHDHSIEDFPGWSSAILRMR